MDSGVLPNSETSQLIEHCFPPSGNMGITFEEMPLRIKELVEGEEAALQTTLKPGDVLISVNGISLQDLEFEAAVEVLRNSVGSPEGRLLVFSRRAPASDMMTERLKPTAVIWENSEGSEEEYEDKIADIDVPVGVKESLLSTVRSGVSTDRTTGRTGLTTGRSKISSTSQILGSIRKQLVTVRTQREEMIKQDDLSKKADVIAPAERLLKMCLERNHTIRPLKVQISNESYWYQNRSILGSKYHMAFSIDHIEAKRKWDARIFRITMDDDQNLVPKSEFLGSHKTEVAAFKACEKAMKERDRDLGRVEGVKYITQEDLLATHFRVVVVSSQFTGKSYVERLSMVFEAMSAEFSDLLTLPQGRSPMKQPMLQMKKFSVVGNSVLSLPFFRNFGKLQAKLIVACYTPSQWKPKAFLPTEEELYTKSRTGAGALSENLKVKDGTSAKALKKILKDERNMNAEQERLKGVYGHFFHALNPEIKRQILEEYSRSQVLKAHDPSKDDPTLLIQKTLPGQATQTTDEMSSTKKKTSKKKGNKDGHTAQQSSKKAQDTLSKSLIEDSILVDKEQELVGAYQIHNRRMAMMAIRIQRIWRMSLLSKAIRWTVQRHYAAVRIQCLVRGVYGRMYGRLFRRVAGVAALRLQCRWRGFAARRRVREWLAVLIPAVIRIQRAYRSHLLLLYIQYLRVYYTAARSIQKVVRGFNARQLYKKKRGRYLPQIKTKPAVRLLQRVWRGHHGRLIYKKEMEAMLDRVVVTPAMLLMQRVFRGGLGRKKTRFKRMERQMAIRIQRIVRGFLKRCWWKKVKYWWFQNRKATEIEKVGRGYIDRQMVALRVEKDWFFEVMQPCAIKIQAVYRGYVERCRLGERKRRWLAALLIQMAFRTTKAIRVVRQRWQEKQLRIKNKAAKDIQKIWRAFSARFHYRVLYADQTWKRLYAGRMIMRAWLRYRTNQRLSVLREEWECQRSGQVLNRLWAERAQVRQDSKDAQDDLSETWKMYDMAKKRVKELREFLKETRIRIPKVEEEIEKLEMEDIEHGWGEAFTDELNRLTNQSTMATEEILLQKVYMRNCKEQINELQLEIEDLMMDLDENNVRVLEELEYLRRLQIQRGYKKQKAHWDKKIRHEKVHWKIQEIRTKVIRRTRKDLDQFEEEAIQQRNNMLDIATTMSFEKLNVRIATEKDEVVERDNAIRKAKYDELAQKVYDNKPVKETYDAVISSTLDILKDFTFDKRIRMGPLHM